MKMFLRATLLCALSVVLASCMPFSLPTSQEKLSKAELARTAPTIPGLTVESVRESFPEFAFTESGDEAADMAVGIQEIGESSVTVTIVSYAPDAVANVSVSIRRPGHATGPLLDRLAVEYLPKLTAVSYDGADPESARTWLTESLMRMSLSGYSDETRIGTVAFTLNVLRNRATLKMIARSNPEMP